MLWLRCFLGGLVGGLIGAAIWVAVGYATGYEVGYIAWGIGFMTGFGVRAMSQDNEGASLGVMAVLVAAVAILLAKYGVVTLHMNKLLAEARGAGFTDANVMIAQEADAIADERDKSGRPVAWPANKDDDDLPLQQQYPADVWSEATERWNKLPPAEQQAKIKQHEEQMDEIMGAFHGAIRRMAFQASFSPYDLLWFGLAAFTAFKLGSGATGDD